MILHVVVFILRILLSESFTQVNELKAVVGKLFQINVSLINGFGNRQSLPDWLCYSSSGYQGIPTKENVQVTVVNDHLSIVVTNKLDNYSCLHRWPTILVLLTDKKFSTMSGCERLKLWNHLQSYFQTQFSNLKFEEDISHLFRSLSILMQWNSNVNNSTNLVQSAILFHIGCGSISEKMIDKLKFLESEDNIKNLSNILSLSIHKWLVGDQFDLIYVRKRRHSKKDLLRFSEFSSVFYRHEKQQKEEWNEGRITIEGSGLFNENWIQWNNSAAPMLTDNERKNYTKSTENMKKPKPSLQNSKPFVKKSLGNITIHVGSTRFYKIPLQTFFDNEDGFTKKLRLKIYLRSKESKTDSQIYLNTSRWIYFIQDQQIIGFRPERKDEGQHDVTVCAYDSDMNRICDGIEVFIKKPQPMQKSDYKNALPGVVWKYRVPEKWADVVKYNSNDSVTVHVQSSAVVSYQQNISTISLITEADISKEHKIKLIAESELTGKTYTWSIYVTVSGHNAYTDPTSPEIVIRIKLLESEKISFELINMLKDKLISIISQYWGTRSPTSRDILLYRIITGKEAFLKPSRDSIIILSFVYSPKKSHINSHQTSTCSEVVISQDLWDSLKLKLHITSKKWIIEMINMINIPGKCLHDEKIVRNLQKVSTTPRIILPESEDKTISSRLLNATINLAVKNGFTFKKIIVYPYEPLSKYIKSMELLDNNSLVIDESSWVFLSTTQFTIYGLPLSENVRRQPYVFKVKVMLQSGRTEVVIVNILVEKFVPNFNHKFGLIISISEKDTFKLDLVGLRLNGNILKTMGQLLVSQTLSYRWQVVQTLASYLYADQCIADCGKNIFIYSFFEPKTWQINVSWSMVFNSPESPEYPTVHSLASCSDIKLKAYIKALIISDQITESIISMFSSSLSIFQSRPNKSLLNFFKSKHLGTPKLINIESSGPCSSLIEKSETDTIDMVLWSNITVYEGRIFTFALDTRKISKSKQWNSMKVSKNIFFLNDSYCDLKWIKLSQDGGIIYGLPLSSDITVQSYFSLRIHLELLETRDKLNYYISISLKPREHMQRNSHLVNMTVLIKTADFENVQKLDYTIRIARSINGYLHPSCSKGNKTKFSESIGQSSFVSPKDPSTQFCENAEDVILYNIDRRNDNENILIDIIWSQVSVSLYEDDVSTSCDISKLMDLSKNLFENYTSTKINNEFFSFIQNMDIGQIINIDLMLFDYCLEYVTEHKMRIPYLKRASDRSKAIYRASSKSSVKIGLSVFLFLAFLIISICIIIYIVKRGLPSPLNCLTEKSSKTIVLEDFSTESKNPLKSPMSSFTKKTNNTSTMESIGPSYSNNSSKTPLLSQFSKEESRMEKQGESSFNDKDVSGSYSQLICQPQSPKAEPSSNSFTGISKQPATSNVIRNPAMMMGSRLNPYRNIPPPII